MPLLQRFARAGALLALSLAAAAPALAGDAAEVFDTGAAAADPLSPEVLTAAAGWTRIPEKTLDHAFKGDAVLRNGGLTVVLRRQCGGAEVYAPTAQGLRLLLTLAPLTASGERAVSLAAVALKEHTGVAVAAEARFQTADGKAAAAVFHLSVGDPWVLDSSAGEGTGRLALLGALQRVVVPDFFGDDMVYSKALPGVSRLGLPTENFFLTMIEGGQAMAMSAWEERERNADLFLAGEGDARRLDRCEVDCAAGTRLSTAVLTDVGAGDRVWHGRDLVPADAGTELKLEWKAPFAAKWRGCFSRADGVSRNQLFAADGAAAIRVPPAPKEGGKPPPVSFLAYPVDRDDDTPFTKFLLVDLLHYAFKQGFCEYILASEGLAGGGEAPPTPNEVTKFVEREIKYKRAATRSLGTIEEKLRRMVGHVGHAAARVGSYEKFGAELRAVCAGEEAKAAGAEAMAAQVLAVLGDMDEAVTDGRRDMKGEEEARKLADALLVLVKENASREDCEATCEEIRAIGHAQDRALSRCRMSARRLKQICRTAEIEGQAAELVAKVKPIVEKQLGSAVPEKH